MNFRTIIGGAFLAVTIEACTTRWPHPSRPSRSTRPSGTSGTRTPPRRLRPPRASAPAGRPVADSARRGRSRSPRLALYRPHRPARWGPLYVGPDAAAARRSTPTAACQNAEPRSRPSCAAWAPTPRSTRRPSPRSCARRRDGCGSRLRRASSMRSGVGRRDMKPSGPDVTAACHEATVAVSRSSRASMTDHPSPGIGTWSVVTGSASACAASGSVT